MNGSLYRVVAPPNDKTRSTALVWCSDEIDGEHGETLRLPVGSLCIVVGSHLIDNEVDETHVEWKKCIITNGSTAWICGDELELVS